MYFRLVKDLCKQSLYRISSSIKLQANKSSYASYKDEEKQKAATASTDFSHYEVIYTFPYIGYARVINITKYRLTILTGASMPAIIGLQLADIISLDVAGASIASGIIIGIWLHTFAILCNNLIGRVYLKQDEQKIILSYLNYWGKRMDLETTLDKIVPLIENPVSITDPLYRKVKFSSQNQVLKINLKLGKITDVAGFTSSFGIV